MEENLEGRGDGPALPDYVEIYRRAEEEAEEFSLREIRGDGTARARRRKAFLTAEREITAEDQRTRREFRCAKQMFFQEFACGTGKER